MSNKNVCGIFVEVLYCEFVKYIYYMCACNILYNMSKIKSLNYKYKRIFLHTQVYFLRPVLFFKNTYIHF